MPRFYFDVREGERFTHDEVGLEFVTLEGAEREAAEAAAEIGRDALPQSTPRQITLEVRNEHSQRVLTVTVWMEIHRVIPEPLPPA